MTFCGTLIKHHFPSEELQNHRPRAISAAQRKRIQFCRLEAPPVLPHQRLQSFHIGNCGSSQSKKREEFLVNIVGAGEM